MRRIWNWTPKQEAKLARVKATLNELKEYWPLTLRQVYYQLVSRQIIENKVTEYSMLSKLLKYARLDGLVPWEAIEDRMRISRLNQGWYDKDLFLQGEIENFLRGYRRHLQQGQANYLEIWIEKDALSSIFQNIANPYCVPVCTCRGFSSVSFLYELKERIQLSQNQEQQAIILYFGDFDPSGEEMLPAMKTTLEDEMDLDGVIYKKVALSKEDITKYDLPHDPNAVKKTDSRYQKFVEKWELYAVELDALPPDVLQNRIRQAIESHIDMELFDIQKATAEEEETKLLDFREKAKSWIYSEWEAG